MIRKLQFALSFLLVLGCQSVYTKMATFPGDILITITCVLTLIVLSVIQLEEMKMTVRSFVLKRFLVNCMFMNSLIVLIFVMNIFFPYRNGNQIISIKESFMILSLLTVFFDLIYMYFLLKKNNKYYFIKDIINSVFVINVISLFFYILGPTLKILSPTNTVSISWGGTKTIASFYNVFFISQPGAYSILSQGRNTGIFVEGPMYAFVIVIAILFELFLLENKKKYRMLIGLIVLITTYSTTGLIVTSVGIVFFIFKNFENKKGGINLSIMAFTPIILLFASRFILNLLNEKINMGHSDDVRINNFSNAIYSWGARPLFGYGFKAEKAGILTGHTSVFSQVIQDGGLAFLLFYTIPFISFIRYSLKKNHFDNVFFVLCYLLLIFNTVITYTTISIAVLAFLKAIELTEEGELLCDI